MCSCLQKVEPKNVSCCWHFPLTWWKEHPCLLTKSIYFNVTICLIAPLCICEKILLIEIWEIKCLVNSWIVGKRHRMLDHHVKTTVVLRCHYVRFHSMWMYYLDLKKKNGSFSCGSFTNEKVGMCFIRVLKYCTAVKVWAVNHFCALEQDVSPMVTGSAV